MTDVKDDMMGSDDGQLDAMLERVLLWMLDAGHADEDQAARHCLTVEELAGVVPAHVRASRATDTVEGLAQFLDPQGDVRPLAGAIRDWKVSLEQVRLRFGWLELPPAVRSRACRRARAVLDRAVASGVVEKCNGLWRLTEAGTRQAESFKNR